MNRERRLRLIFRYSALVLAVPPTMCL